jgi:single-strand DNA-binding protein
MSNAITIVGNLASDPEFAMTSNGKARCSFKVLTSKSRKNEAGQWENIDTTGWTCTAWEQTAENINLSLKKGDPVVVIGNAAYRSWEDKDGKPNGRIEVQVQEIALSLKRFSATANRIARSSAPAPSSATQVDPWDTPVF